MRGKVYLYESQIVELVVEMLTAGLAFDCPHVWDTQTLIDLNDGRSLLGLGFSRSNWRFWDFFSMQRSRNRLSMFGTRERRGWERADPLDLFKATFVRRAYLDMC